MTYVDRAWCVVARKSYVPNGRNEIVRPVMLCVGEVSTQ